jgi:hypothetical protein
VAQNNVTSPSPSIDLAETYRLTVMELMRLQAALAFAILQFQSDNSYGALQTLVEACWVRDGENN